MLTEEQKEMITSWRSKRLTHARIARCAEGDGLRRLYTRWSLSITVGINQWQGLVVCQSVGMGN